MKPTLAVMQVSDSFAGVWAELAEAADVRLDTGAETGALAPLGEACGLLLVVAGEEGRARAWLAELRSAGAEAVAVVGADADHRLAVQALRAGAAEYFALPADLEALRAWVQDQADAARARGRARALAEEEKRNYDFSGLIGESAGLGEALRVAAAVIPRATTTVLLTGETGTGKELLARAIHYNGPRAAAPFIEVNCSALPPNLLEAELFGYEKGAFTDARAAKPGLFEAAHGGTLFLDEIGDLAPEFQAKLLRALEEKRVRRLGSIRAVDVDVRIIAATHVDLAAAVEARRFREDLYYRLNVVRIRLPALRERGDDVLLLAEHFLKSFAELLELPVPALDRQAREALVSHSWPGNIRELRNAIERVILLGGGEFRPSDLLLEGRPRIDPRGSALPFPARLEAIERAAARLMLERAQGNKSAAADALGISRTRLYRLLADQVDGL
jgi:DNA-binding NtrC family response regulator